MAKPRVAAIDILGQSACCSIASAFKNPSDMETPKHLIAVLTTVNAFHQEKLDAATLAACLSDLNLAKLYSGHVSAFLGDVPISLQVEFALAHGIAPHQLAALAISFSKWSGESYPLAG